MGLLRSSHPDNKSQIPVKNIIEIFKKKNTAALIQAFLDKLESLDTEISTLSELRQLVDDFLHKMLMSGIKKISAITLLYEETEKRLAIAEKGESLTFEKLSEISREALKLHDVRVIRFPPMRLLTSRLKTGHAEKPKCPCNPTFFPRDGCFPLHRNIEFFNSLSASFLFFSF